MNQKIQKAKYIVGEVVPPADKSITHRAIMISAMSEGECVIENYLNAEDCMRTVSAVQNLGIRVEINRKALKIHGEGVAGLKTAESVIDCGNSGTTARLIAGMIAGQNIMAQIAGDESLSSRPMKRIIEPLRDMGAKIIAREGNYLPLQIKGNPELQPIFYKSPIPSAQVKSCILLAGIQAKGVTRIQETTKSRDHTERMLLERGVDIRTDEVSISVVGPAVISAMRMRVPGDISSIAFFVIAAALMPSSKILIKRCGVNPTRTGLIDVLKQMNAKIKLANPGAESGEPFADIEVESSELAPFVISEEMMPSLIDEVPILVLAATQANGTSVIRGAAELRVKESDRLKTIASELNKMGAHITEQPDGLIINGPTPLIGAQVKSFKDHRIAMTLAIAGLIASKETSIEDVDCVKTSYPGFFAELKRLTK